MMTNASMSETEIPALHSLLRKTVKIAGPHFSGIGVIVTDDLEALPIFPLRPDIVIDASAHTAELLGSISVERGPQHDGFHVLSPDMSVRAISQYFSPPIVKDLTIDRSHPFGGRYLAALFGSTLDGVLATGIATTTLGIVTFERGHETSRETWR